MKIFSEDLHKNLIYTQLWILGKIEIFYIFRRLEFKAALYFNKIAITYHTKRDFTLTRITFNANNLIQNKPSLGPITLNPGPTIQTRNPDPTIQTRSISQRQNPGPTTQTRNPCLSSPCRRGRTCRTTTNGGFRCI